MKVRSVFLVFGLLLASRPSGAAQSAPLSLLWHAPAPATCPTAADVEAEVLRLAGTELRVTQSLEVEATAALGQDGKWTLTLRTRLGGVSGERVLRGDSCREVAEAGALVLALTLNPELERGRPPQSEQVMREVCEATGLGLSTCQRCLRSARDAFEIALRARMNASQRSLP
jgi:hypothetical protein